jgi:type IV secretion system protein VirD4
MHNIAMSGGSIWGDWPWNAIWVLYMILLLIPKDSKEARLRRALREFKPENSLGAAKVTEKNRALKKAGLFDGKGVQIGYSPNGRHALHYSGLGHLLTVAAARTGKGATLLVNALLSWRHSCIIIDPKCENALITARFRRRFGKVYILNPFKLFPHELGGMQARFNPMQIISAESSLSFHALCDKLAAALVWEEGNSEGRHWTTAARILVSGIIAALIRHGDPARRTLVEVARVISSGDELFTFCRNAMQSNDPFIIQKLKRFALAPGAEPSREMHDVIATAITNLAFIGNAAIAESLSGSDFRFSDLKRKPGTTVFICLPLATLDVTDKFFRLILESALAELLNEGTHS